MVLPFCISCCMHSSVLYRKCGVSYSERSLISIFVCFSSSSFISCICFSIVPAIRLMASRSSPSSSDPVKLAFTA